MPPDVDLAGPVDSSWDGEDFDEPLLHFAVNKRGDLVGLRLVARGKSNLPPVIHVPPRRERGHAAAELAGQGQAATVPLD
jgi:hypothetical protein